MPYCSSCGKQVTKNAQYCTNCGHSITEQAKDTTGNKEKASKLSTAVLICGIAGLVCSIALVLLIMVVGFWLFVTMDSGGGPSDLQLNIIFGIIVGFAGILDLSAIILGVACLLRKPTSVSRRSAKKGLLLGAIGPILFALWWIWGYVMSIH